MNMRALPGATLLLLVLAVIAAAAQRPSIDAGRVGASARRLPQTVFPEHYDLHFVPDLAEETFCNPALRPKLLTQSGLYFYNSKRNRDVPRPGFCF